jgi:hypothetical protein
MRVEVYFVLGFLIFHEDARTVCGKSIVATDPSVEKEFSEYLECSRVNGSSECLESTGALDDGEDDVIPSDFYIPFAGRKRKGGSGGGGNNVNIICAKSRVYSREKCV